MNIENLTLPAYVQLMMIRGGYVESGVSLTEEGAAGLTVEQWQRINQELCATWPEYKAGVLKFLTTIKVHSTLRSEGRAAEIC